MNKNRNKNTWGSNWRKNKNIEARQNVTGSYKKRVYIHGVIKGNQVNINRSFWIIYIVIFSH